MSRTNYINRMSVNLLDGYTTFGVDIKEDIGIAIRNIATIEIRIAQKFESLNADTQVAVDKFIEDNREALGV